MGPCGLGVLGGHMDPRVELLGTGNAFLPRGRLHSMALLDGQHLIDASPTALVALRRGAVRLQSPAPPRPHLHGTTFSRFPPSCSSSGRHPRTGGCSSAPHLVRPGAPSTAFGPFPNLPFGSLGDHAGKRLRSWGPQKGNSGGWSKSPLQKFHLTMGVDPGYRFFMTPGAEWPHRGDSGPCATLEPGNRGVGLALVGNGRPRVGSNTDPIMPRRMSLLWPTVIQRSGSSSPTPSPTMGGPGPRHRLPHSRHAGERPSCARR
ncbi:MAG: hypothetical protein CM15mP18_3710 [Methanobacteriota archaeon]|nr:MAG: hypothetical protein CM15mP18_3710 [Euryarchaeota archaeon]